MVAVASHKFHSFHNLAKNTHTHTQIYGKTEERIRGMRNTTTSKRIITMLPIRILLLTIIILLHEASRTHTHIHRIPADTRKRKQNKTNTKTATKKDNNNVYWMSND